jgi:8-oxo-dGTP diphosphatase
MTTTPAPDVIQAAGGLLWRECAGGREVAIVHRKRHGDWTLPKGKLKEGESWQAAALREVEEETGYPPTLGDPAGAIAYEVGGAPKIARFWHMSPQGGARDEVDAEEVAEVHWLPPDKALKRLSHPLERALLEACPPPAALTGEPKRASRWFSRHSISVSLERLRYSLETLETDLDDAIERARTRSTSHSGWDRRARRLVAVARKAYDDGDAELGWRAVKAVDRYLVYGQDAAGLLMEARPVLHEAIDEQKGLSKWRTASVRALLCDAEGKLRSDLTADQVVRAKRLVDEHQDNVYQKLGILRSRLRLLSVAGLIALAVWLIVPPFAPPGAPALASASSAFWGQAWLGPRLAWLGIVLAGILGALFSGFSTSMSTDQAKTRIPVELSSSAVTAARLTMGVVASLAISIFFVSGALNLVQPTYELLLAVAFVAGFSDRLLLRAIESVVK